MNNIHVAHNGTFWLYGITFLVWLVLLFNEYRRKNKRLLIVRMLAVSLILLSVICIFLKPYMETRKPNKSVYLFAEDSELPFVDSLYRTISKQKDAEALVLQEHQSQYTINFRKKHVLSNISEFYDRPYIVDTLHIVGQYSGAYQIPADTVVFLDTYSHKIEFDYKPYLFTGDSLRFDFKNVADTVVTVRLVNDQSKEERSKLLKAGESNSLSFLPKRAGFHFFTLYQNDTLYQKIWVHVAAEKKLTFLMKAASPDFEWKYLKNFMGSEGHQVLLETAVSENIYKRDVANWPDSLAKKWTNVTIELADVLIIDAMALNNMSRRELMNISSLLKKNKVCLVIRANENMTLQRKVVQNLQLPSIRFSERYEEVNGVDKVLLPGVSDQFQDRNQGYYFFKNAVVPTGIVNRQNEFLTLLKGDSAHYKNYWISLFNHLLVPEQKPKVIVSEWNTSDSEIHVDVWLKGEKPELIISGFQYADTISLHQNRRMPELWEGNHTVDTSGWYFVSIAGVNDSVPFYVHNDEILDIDPQKAARQWEATEQLKKASAITKSQPKKQYLHYWLFGLVALLITFLWIEQKR